MVSPRFILATMVVAQLADAATFVIGVARLGIDFEANVFARLVHSAVGLDGVLIAKGSMLLMALGLLVYAAHRFPRVVLLGGAAATSLGLLGFVGNTASTLLLA